MRKLVPGSGPSPAPKAAKPAHKYAVQMPMVMPKTREEIAQSRQLKAKQMASYESTSNYSSGVDETSPDTDFFRDQRYALDDLQIDLIDPNPFAPREIYTDEMLLQRAEDLRTQKQNDAIHVIPNPDVPGRYIIADGWTRVQACLKHAVRTDLRAIVHTHLSMQEAAWLGYNQNEGRSQQCDFDRAMFYEKLIAEGAIPAEVARRANVSRSMMTFYRSFAKLPDDVLVMIKERPSKFSAKVAYELSKICATGDIRKAISIALKYAEEDQTYRWLANQVQAVLRPAEKSAKPSLNKHYRYANGFYKQREDEFEVSIAVPKEQRDSFAKALEELLSTVTIAEAIECAPTIEDDGTSKKEARP